jgi:hypothetical protein
VEDAVQAIEYAVENGAAVLNNSYGRTDFSQALSDAIGDAEAHNSLFVAAAGNSATDNDVTPTYPASDPYASVLSVAATTNRDQQAWFSNYGRTSVDLGAPGDGIYSTWIGGSYAAASGTSMAAPHVAGGAALARAVLPSAMAVGLKALLLRTADPNAALAGRTRTGARLDVDGAVRCTGAQVWIEQPASGFVAALGDTVQISAIGASCGNPGGAIVTATVNGQTIGLTPRGDGLYTGSYKATAPGPVAITVSASSAGGSDSLTVSGQVPTPIVPGGAPVTVSVGNPDETRLLELPGTAGQRVSVNLTGVTMSLVSVRLLKPDGTGLGSSALVGTPGGFMDVRTLPVTGTYRLLVDPQGTATGSITLTLYDVPADVSASTTVGGAPVTVSTTVPGQNAAITFSGSAGQRVSMKFTGLTMGSPIVRLLKPDGTTVGSSVSVGSPEGFVDTRTLPVAGVYSIGVDLKAAATGSATLTLYNVPADVAVSASPGGPPVTIATTVPGQNASATFSGATGQRVSVKLSGVTMSLATVSLLKPDGTPLGSNVVVGTAAGSWTCGRCRSPAATRSWSTHRER